MKTSTMKYIALPRSKRVPYRNIGYFFTPFIVIIISAVHSSTLQKEERSIDNRAKWCTKILQRDCTTILLLFFSIPCFYYFRSSVTFTKKIKFYRKLVSSKLPCMLVKAYNRYILVLLQIGRVSRLTRGAVVKIYFPLNRHGNRVQSTTSEQTNNSKGFRILDYTRVHFNIETAITLYMIFNMS